MKKELEIYINKITAGISVKESWVQNNLKELYSNISILNGISFQEKVFIYINKNYGYCKICNKKTKFLSFLRGYRPYCSKKCSNGDVELIYQKSNKYEKTCIDKYGYKNSSMNYDVKEKTKKTNLEKYGNHPSKIQKTIDKCKKTCIDKYGYDNVSKLSMTKEKKLKTNLEKIGVDNPFQSEGIKNKIKKTNLEKYGYNHAMQSNCIKEKYIKTSLEKYGVNNYTKTNKYKETMFDKYHQCDIKTDLNSNPNYVKYIGNGEYELKCENKDHTYIINSHLYHARKNLNNPICTICYPISSQFSIKEKKLLEFIKSIYDGEIIDGYRNGQEIDIYLPDLKIGFEFNGLYWHSELYKNKNYHIDKTNHFKEKGIRVIHIWEDDWVYKQEVIKSQILNWLGLVDNKIYARKCQIKEIKDPKISKNFLDINHIQGHTPSSLKLGLFYNNELVSLMTFDHFEGRKKMMENEWNLSRFCNLINTNVIGGASKLLSYFIKTYNPNRIISFADKSWSDGGLYYKLGFNLKSDGKPDYKYIIGNKRINKQKFKKSNLIKMGYDKNKSESEIMKDEFKSLKIFDCGQLKFEFLYIKNEN